MAGQNIYDNEPFYEGYKQIREKKINANTLFEKRVNRMKEVGEYELKTYQNEL